MDFVPFEVIGYSKTMRGPVHAHFAVMQDNWDDYGFKTTYQLYHNNNGRADLIGTIKILRRGQKTGYENELKIGQRFDKLSDEFCSAGQSLDYYERLARLPSELRQMALYGLRDIVANPSIRSEFRNELGYSKSLFRDTDENVDHIGLADALLRGSFDTLPATHLSLTFHPTGWENALEFSFDAPATKYDIDLIWDPKRRIKVGLPRRIAVLIGRNGSGKSTLLMRFARVAYASPDERIESPILRALGSISPHGLGFTRIIAISYSAFDSFQIPGTTVSDRERIVSDLETQAGRFVFCGLRDIAAEVRRDLAEDDKAPNQSDRSKTSLLKPIEKLADEFVEITQKIFNSPGKFDLLLYAIEPVLVEPSFGSDNSAQFLKDLTDDTRENFLRLSTGHKIVLHIIASLVLHIEPKSIVLFDEPESHLHPPLLAALMHAIRAVLDKRDAFAILATHSPVVLQETLSRHVKKIRRDGDIIKVEATVSETFGENVGLLTYDAFQLTAGATDYHLALQNLANQYSSLEEIEALFDRGLSSQARAYIMSLLAEKKSG
ncbi:MAG: ATP-binding protein [Proteobacteria bacterium]|nr:ATP-binding protein [Pseudomonadota bacterium]